MSILLANNNEFLKQDYPALKPLLTELSDTQRPRTILITCADSRVVPNLVTKTNPGDVFIIRNAGNIVAPYEAGKATSGEWCSIEYAVAKIPTVCEIVVCGHSNCGAMNAVMAGGKTGLDGIDGWLQHSADTSGCESLQDLTEKNVLLQLERLAAHPLIKEKMDAGSLRLHGWYFDVPSGEIRQVLPVEKAVG